MCTWPWTWSQGCRPNISYQKKNLEKKFASSTGDFCILRAPPVWVPCTWVSPAWLRGDARPLYSPLRICSECIVAMQSSWCPKRVEKKQKNCTSSVTLRASLGFFLIIIPPLAKTQCLLVRFPSFIFCCKSQSASTTFLSLTLSLLSPSHSVTGRGQSILYGLANNRNVISTPTGFRVILWHQTQEAQVSWSEKMWEVTGVQNSQNVNYPDFNYTQLKGNLERKEE